MKLVAIGFMGHMRVYVGLERNQAVKRYNQENPDYTVEAGNLTVRELEVKDSFEVYDIWECQ